MESLSYFFIYHYVDNFYLFRINKNNIFAPEINLNKNYMKKVILSALVIAGIFAVSCSKDDDKPAPSPAPEQKGVPTNQEAFSGSYKLGNAEEVKTHFTRVLYAVESNEKDAAPWNDAQIQHDGTDPQGNAVKTKRFQIVTKNVGAEIKTIDQLKAADQSAGKTMKSLTDGVKLFVEVPLDAQGKLLVDKAYVGNLGYKKVDDTQRVELKTPNEQIESIKFNLTRLELPVYNGVQPGNHEGASRYNEGYIKFELEASVRPNATVGFQKLVVKVDSPISVTQIRGKDKANKVAVIDPNVVNKNRK